jgi:hypothetical protein
LGFQLDTTLSHQTPVSVSASASPTASIIILFLVLTITLHHPTHTAINLNVLIVLTVIESVESNPASGRSGVLADATMGYASL